MEKPQRARSLFGRESLDGRSTPRRRAVARPCANAGVYGKRMRYAIARVICILLLAGLAARLTVAQDSALREGETEHRSFRVELTPRDE